MLSPIPYPLSEFNISYKVPNRETTTRSKQAAARLLDRLARDALQSAMKEGYIKVANMLGDIADACIPWMIDILVCSIDIDCNDKLSWFCHPLSLFSYHPPSYAQHASSFVPYR